MISLPIDERFAVASQRWALALREARDAARATGDARAAAAISELILAGHALLTPVLAAAADEAARLRKDPSSNQN